MFTENKYSKYYFRIIENRQRNPLNGYVEKHHIIPCCFFKNKQPVSSARDINLYRSRVNAINSFLS